MTTFILGTAQICSRYGVNNSQLPSEQRAKEILQTAYGLRIRHLDTASAYENSMSVIGSYHRDFPKNKFEVFSKFLGEEAGSIEQSRRAHERELGVTHLCGFFFHRYSDYLNFNDRSSVEKSQLASECLGVSLYTAGELKQVCDDDHISLVQLPLSIFHHKSELSDFLRKVKIHKKIYIRSVFLQGLVFKDPESLPTQLRSFTPSLRFVHKMAAQYETSVEVLSIGYVLYRMQQLGASVDGGVVIGGETPRQIEQSYQAFLDATYSYKSINWDTDLAMMPQAEESLLHPGNWNIG